jgi:hypothetical protein
VCALKRVAGSSESCAGVGREPQLVIGYWNPGKIQLSFLPMANGRDVFAFYLPLAVLRMAMLIRKPQRTSRNHHFPASVPRG